MLFCAIYALFILQYVTSTGTFFGEDETFGERKEGSTFSKTFHECGIDDNCRYVMQNSKTRKFTKLLKKEDLPHAKKDFNVWYRKDVRSKLDQGLVRRWCRKVVKGRKCFESCRVYQRGLESRRWNLQLTRKQASCPSPVPWWVNRDFKQPERQRQPERHLI